jgi:P-type conjugative transfer protein TrbJ
MNRPNYQRSKSRYRKAAAVLALGVGAAVTLAPVRRAAACWFNPIIFDPSAMAEHVEEVNQLGQQIDLAIQQVAIQTLQLAHLSGNVAPSEPTMVSGLEGQLEASLYQTSSPANQLNMRYSADMSSASWQDFQSDEATWISDERQSLVENRQLQNQVYRDMPTAQQQVQRIVEASNAAPGETAALQAHNDLLAVASGELAKLQTLKMTRSRLHTEQAAREQSEQSFAAAEQGRVRSNWSNPAPSSESLSDPFGD